MGCKCCKAKPLEKRLEGNKLYEIYQAVVDDPDTPSQDPAFTRAQMALRLDILRGKLMWTGCKSQDFKYYLWFSHPLFSIFCANPVDCFTRSERGGVLFMQTCINSLLSFVTLQVKKMEIEEKDPDQAQNLQYAIWILQFGGAVFLTIIVGFLKLLATCSCVQGIRCWGNWKCCCFSGPCCVKSIRSCFEFIGAFGLFVFGIISAITIIVVLAASLAMGMADTFFRNFFLNLVISWGGAVAMHFLMFYKLSYKKENKKMLKGKTKFEMTCQDFENKGVELQHRPACSKCLTCCLPCWRIFTAVMMFGDHKDFKVVQSVNVEDDVLIIETNAANEVVEETKELLHEEEEQGKAEEAQKKE